MRSRSIPIPTSSHHGNKIHARRPRGLAWEPFQGFSCDDESLNRALWYPTRPLLTLISLGRKDGEPVFVVSGAKACVQVSYIHCLQNLRFQIVVMTIAYVFSQAAICLLRVREEEASEKHGKSDSKAGKQIFFIATYDAWVSLFFPRRPIFPTAVSVYKRYIRHDCGSKGQHWFSVHGILRHKLVLICDLLCWNPTAESKTTHCEVPETLVGYIVGSHHSVIDEISRQTRTQVSVRSMFCKIMTHTNTSTYIISHS
jgi:hypothetical protein